MPQYNVYQDIDQTLRSGNFVYDLDAINQSIFNLLTTPKGSRIFLAAYGTNIESIIFELDDSVTTSMIYKEIIDAISLWERNRIRLNPGACTVRYDPSNHEYLVNLVYSVNGLEGQSFKYTFGITP